MDLKNKKVLVFGLGRSGVSAARLLCSKGAFVTVTDAKDREALKGSLSHLRGLKINIEVGGHRIESLLSADLIVLSPGVPPTIEPLKKAKDRGVRIISELELASRFVDAPIIGVTGTNGKSTTTILIGEILKKGGKDVFVGGNLGIPLCEAVLQKKRRDFVVSEVSSFQLEAIEEFRPHVGLLLNITPDHLDRYTSMKEYIEAKKRLFENQKKEDFAILNADDPYTAAMAARIKSKVFLFSRRRSLSEGIYTKRDLIFSRVFDKEVEICHVDDLGIKGVHNLENALASIGVAAICEIDTHDICQVLKDFQGLEHRLELVEVINGVKYVNDSKGTNVGAVIKSLEGFSEPIILIAGGLDKGSYFTPLAGLVKKKVKTLILLGKARDKICKALGDLTETVFAESMEEAVNKAYGIAKEGDVVLLSPACASFDMFKDYEDRGRVFKEAVRRLLNRRSH